MNIYITLLYKCSISSQIERFIVKSFLHGLCGFFCYYIKNYSENWGFIMLLEDAYRVFSKLKEIEGYLEKSSFLDRLEIVVLYLSDNIFWSKWLSTADDYESYLIKSLISIGQGPTVLSSVELLDDVDEKIQDLVSNLKELEKFYSTLGGVIGYHFNFLKLMGCQKDSEESSFQEPPMCDFTSDTALRRDYAARGLAVLPMLAEVYPIGGAGERLGLVDIATGEALPAAKLEFNGRNLLEGMVADLQAREYCYFREYGEQITVPIIMMTSQEKNNDSHIRQICSDNRWFGRPKDSFFFIKQPLTPIITASGEWALEGPLQLALKPGGHGVLWKLMKESGVLKALKDQGKTKLLVRQINNPLAGLDEGILALIGFGCHHNKKFGVASCQRIVGAAEGMLVLRRREGLIGISNIEYTDFIKSGLQDLPSEEGGRFSKYPSNTNILFLDIQSLEEAIKQEPFPGLLLNMKSNCLLYQGGDLIPVVGGRLESAMQNISDVMHDSGEGETSTFLTCNDRGRTISVTKKQYSGEGPIMETPEGCYYDLMNCMRGLFSVESLPKQRSTIEYIEKGPEFIFSYHPALGPDFGSISKKIRGLVFAENSELVLNVSEIEVEKLDLQGSMVVEAENITGSLSHYSRENIGSCVLKNVKVKNLGIERHPGIKYWTGNVIHYEKLSIKLHGNGRFYAEGVTFHGNENIEVSDGYIMTAVQQKGVVSYGLKKHLLD